jgi:GNAT superfamily N-acetyltransferase
MIAIGVEPLAGKDARELLAALDAELARRYPNPEDNFLDLAEEDVAPGRGAFVIARDGERPVGCGAVRLLPEGPDGVVIAEIKRMYVAPEARGRRLANLILTVLEAEARRLRAHRLVLEAGARQPEALALYRRAGFVPIPRFGPYADAPESLCFAKTLGS